MICKYKVAWDFEDYKGWDAFLGQREEGQITWRNSDNELVRDKTVEEGFSYVGYVPNHNLSGDGYKTFEEAVAAFEKAVFNL